MRSFAYALLGAMVKQIVHRFLHPRRSRTVVRAVAFAPETKAYIPAQSVERTQVLQDDIASALADCLHEQWQILESVLHVAEGLTRDEAIDLLRHLNELNYSFDALRRIESLRADMEYAVYLRRAHRHITSQSDGR